jgi:hypothetical protein
MPEPQQRPNPLPPGRTGRADAVAAGETRGEDEDIITLILEDHARIRGLFAELSGEELRPSPAAVWAELGPLLLAHLQAAEEICYLPFLDGAADRRASIGQLCALKDDACDAVADVRLREPESVSWWLAVRAAQAAAYRHAECVESLLLPRGRLLPEDSRRMLGRAWRRFMAGASAGADESD